MMSNLTPRKGHFSFSPWQRHGKTVPQKSSGSNPTPAVPALAQVAGPDPAALIGAQRAKIAKRNS